MRWKPVFALSAFGAAMGAASVLGWTAGVEPVLWLAIAAICSVVLARMGPSRPFLHGFAAGALGGIASPLVQAAFFDVYLRNNPHLVPEYAQIPQGLDPRLFVLAISPGIALASGVVLGALTMAVARLGWPLPRRRRFPEAS